MVIRSLLRKRRHRDFARLEFPPTPFPSLKTPRSPHNLEIRVLESQADEARKVIAEYLAGNAAITEDNEDSDDSTN